MCCFFENGPLWTLPLTGGSIPDMCKNTSPLERVNFALFPQISDCSKRINLRLPSVPDYSLCVFFVARRAKTASRHQSWGQKALTTTTTTSIWVKALCVWCFKFGAASVSLLAARDRTRLGCSIWWAPSSVETMEAIYMCLKWFGQGQHCGSNLLATCMYIVSSTAAEWKNMSLLLAQDLSS